MSEIILGIDLGTTNSEVAIIIDGQPRLLKIEGSELIPSVIAINQEGEVLVGQTAVNYEMADPDNTARWIKRKMGREEIISLQGRTFSPPMVSSCILSYLKKSAEQIYGPISKAVITVPAFFTEKQREATKLAGELAGLEVVRLLNEPTAAALSYSLGKKNKELSLVYDLGGGTFDVSIVDLSEGVMEVLASDGDIFLGGSDFDLMIAHKIQQDFLHKHKIDLKEDLFSWNRILRAAEAAKIRLSTEHVAEILEEFIAEKEGIPLHIKSSISRVEFEKMIRPSLDKTMLSVQRALKQAGHRASDLDKVILVGGSTYIPLVSQLLQEEIGLVPQAWRNPELVVAEGAAIEGAILHGQSLGTVMLDILSHSIGIEVLNESRLIEYEILLHKNDKLPCVASRLFCKTHYLQDAVEIVVRQGDAYRLEDNPILDTFSLEGLEESDQPDICVKLEMDLSGILRVTVTDIGLGKQASLEIKHQHQDHVTRAHLGNLQMVKITPSSQIEISEQETGTVVEELRINEELIERAMQLLVSQDLSSTEQEEVRQAIQQAKEGDPRCLEDLLCYME
ncbi:MAG: Hsp70 family protein [Chlamydiae bacterium]|nr:Hsp70 family protein [Chlamydiota bacterium]